MGTFAPRIEVTLPISTSIEKGHHLHLLRDGRRPLTTSRVGPGAGGSSEDAFHHPITLAFPVL